MKIFIGSDHAGFEMKQFIKQQLPNFILEKIEIKDIGTNNNSPCDYPDIAKKMVKSLKRFIPFKKTSIQKNFGILICGTGIGMCMVANKFKKIRAVVCDNEDYAKISRLHNNANVLCLGARTTKKSDIIKIITTFLKTEYEGGRHNARINKI